MRYCIVLLFALLLSLLFVSANAFQAGVPWDSGPSTITSNCPTTPPGPAQRAGFTTLVYCLDGADAQYAQQSAWVSCGTFNTPPQHWGGGGFDCVRDGRGARFDQGVDPETGKYVIDFVWHNDRDTDYRQGCPDQPSGCLYALSSKCGDIFGPCTGIAVINTMANQVSGNKTSQDLGWINYPRTHYTEIRFREDPPWLPNFAQITCCMPDFFQWNTDQYYFLPTPAVYGTTEIDIVESVFGTALLDGVTASCYGNICFGYFGGNFADGRNLWRSFYTDGSIPFQHMHDFGFMSTMDSAATRIHNCYYWDQQPLAQAGRQACGDSGPLQYGAQNTFVERHGMILWAAGGVSKNDPLCHSITQQSDGLTPHWNHTCQQDPVNFNADTHMYIEYAAVWSCPAWNNYNNGNGQDTQPPCALGVAE